MDGDFSMYMKQAMTKHTLRRWELALLLGVALAALLVIKKTGGKRAAVD